MPLLHFDFNLVDTDLTRPVYYCNSSEHALWLTHPVAKSLYEHQTFCQDFAEGLANSLQAGYHQFDALIVASIYASKCQSNKDGIVYQGFPEIFLEFPNKVYQPINKNNTPAHPIGIYPIIDQSNWLKKFAGTGIKTIQLRIKSCSGSALEQEIAQAVMLAQTYQLNLFINDYWQLAIKYQAHGVHLGQEDLALADIQAIKDAGLRLGISTHCHFEVARAHGLNPDYLAIGPIFATQTKPMAFAPQGLAGLTYWRKQLTEPLVAIAGINSINSTEVVTCLDKQRDGIAMITALTQAKNPDQVARKLQTLFI